MSDPFIAEIKMMGCNFAPRGWAFCDGQLLPISQNTALFSLLGTTYGGDGRTTFALPDLKGRTGMHSGRGPGLTDRRIGEKGGVQTVTLSLAMMATHNHTARAKTAGGTDVPTNMVWGTSGTGKGALNFYAPAGGAAVNMNENALAHMGGNQAHNNLMPYTCVYYCIALQGLFPQRS